MENKTKTIKRTRNNGEGSITKRKGRKKPFEVTVTLGYEVNEETGKLKRIQKSLGYFETLTAAKEVLNGYNAQKVENERTGAVSRFKETITFEQLYREWEKQFFSTFTESTKMSYTCAFKALKTIHDKKFISLYTDDFRKAMLDSGKNYPTLRKVKVLLTRLCKYAIENRLTIYNASETLSLKDNVEFQKNPNKIERHNFENDVIKYILNDSVNVDFADTLKFLLYTGVRIQEMLDLKIENVNLEENYVKIIESKTVAGLRIIPIHPELLPVVKKWVKKSSEKNIEYLFHSVRNKKYEYDGYRIRYWDRYFQGTNFRYLPHDTRHTFSTVAEQCGMDVKKKEVMMGHTVEWTIEGIYRHYSIEELHAEMKKLNYYN